MISFIFSIILPIAVYLFIQITLLIIVNRFLLRNKLKFKEIINIAITSGLVIPLVWIIISVIFIYIIGSIGMLVGMSSYALLGPVVATFFTFLFFKKNIIPYTKNISIKAVKNLCIFMMLFNIFLIFFFLALARNVAIHF